MSLRARKILFILFLVSFFTITPLVIFYAAGYQLDLTEKRFAKTGILILDTKPENAKIFINSREQKNILNGFWKGQTKNIITPAKIKGLLPGEYEVEMNLEGYHSWKKKLNIYPGQSTYAEDVILFKNDLPVMLFAQEKSFVYPSPDKRYLLLTGQKETMLYDTADEQIVYAIKTAPVRPQWSNNGRNFYLDGKIYDVKNPSPLAILAENEQAEIIGNWDAKNGDIFHFYQKNVLSNFNLATRQTGKNQIDANGLAEILPGAKIEALQGHNNRLVIIAANANKKLFINLDGKGQIANQLELPTQPKYEFVNPNDRAVNIYDSENKVLYLFDENQPVKKMDVLENVKYTHWIDGDRLLGGNEAEIFIYDRNSKNKDLLTRISEPIEDAFWHPSDNYIIYRTNNLIRSLELDKRDRHNTTDIGKFDRINSLFIDNKGGLIYLSAQIGKQDGFYKIGL